MIQDGISSFSVQLLRLAATIYIFSCIISLLRNIRYARSTGLSYVVYPVFHFNPFITVLFSLRIIQNLFDSLPLAWADYFNNWTYATKWKVRNRMRESKGGLYLQIAPGGIWAAVGDAAVVVQITSQRERFPKPLKNHGPLLLFGKNLVATEGKDWVHHRKYTTPAFNERSNAFVWQESLQQAVAMVETWTPLRNLSDDLMRLALHTISSAGFGVPMNFSSRAQREVHPFTSDIPQGYTFSYRSAMHFISFNAITHVTIMSLPRWFSKLFFSAHNTAHKDFNNYLHALINNAKRNRNGNDNVLNLMLDKALNECEIQQPNNTKRVSTGLNTSELIGNLFIISLAGHETTARTLHYALIMLALHPNAHDWLTYGIDTVFDAECSEPSSWDYSTVFPKLVEPLCLMLETLRYFCIIPSLLKQVAPGGTSIVYDGRTIYLREMNINLDTFALHHCPEYYGPDAHLFSPQRWDMRNADSFLAKNTNVPGLRGAGLEYDSVHKPVRGAFLSFSDGVRACLGRKFAVVEFCAVIVVLLRKYRVEIARKDGESEQVARERAWNALDKSTAIIALGMLNPEEVKIQLRER